MIALPYILQILAVPKCEMAGCILSTHGALALAEAHVSPGIGFEGAIVVGNHQGVGAQTLAATGISRRAAVLEPVKEPFFAQQAVHVGEVALVVLDA
jgi:hypothetical protein